MLIGEATRIAGTLGRPSKMPGWSTSTSALKCQVGSKLRKVPGSVCEGCYAMGANYQYPSVKVAHARRFEGLRHPEWVSAMVTLIDRRVSLKDPYFRWHDSGDLQGVWHLRNICEVARLTPKVRHWLPTREKQMIRALERSGVEVSGNLTIRLSGSMIDGPQPRSKGPTSTVSSDGSVIGHLCPAADQGNECGACRACWDPQVGNVTYRKH